MINIANTNTVISSDDGKIYKKLSDGTFEEIGLLLSQSDRTNIAKIPEMEDKINNLSLIPKYPNMGDRLLATAFTSYYIGNSPTMTFEANVPVLIATIKTDCFIKVGLIETVSVIPDNTLVWVMLTYNDAPPEGSTTSTILYKRLRKTIIIEETKYYLPPDLDGFSSWVPVTSGANIFILFGNTFNSSGSDLFRIGGCGSL